MNLLSQIGIWGYRRYILVWNQFMNLTQTCMQDYSWVMCGYGILKVSLDQLTEILTN